MKKKFFLVTIYLITSFIYYRAGPAWIENWEIDPATYLFFSFLPIIWLLKISWKINSIIAIFFVILMAYFSLLKFENTSENMAIMVFFFFVTSVFQRIKELAVSRNNNEKISKSN